MNVFLDYGPDTAEETALKDRLRALQSDYHAAARPILERLTAIQLTKQPRTIFLHETRQELPS